MPTVSPNQPKPVAGLAYAGGHGVLRITIDPGKMRAVPCIRGLPIPATTPWPFATSAWAMHRDEIRDHAAAEDRVVISLDNGRIPSPRAVLGSSR